MQPRALHTTGRLSTRMNAADKARLQQRLAAYTPTPQYLAQPPQPLEVELGIGNGEALHARAAAQPHMQFLGCEIYLNGLRSLAATLHKTPLPNLHVANQDARELLQNLAPASAHRLLVLFPDPWPKARHHKRRLLQADFLTAAARILQPGAELWVVTDWPSYAYHTLAALHAHPAFSLIGTHLSASACKVAPTGDGPRVTGYESFGPALLATPPAWWAPTKYQQKAAAQGRFPWFISAQRVSPA